MKPPDVMLAVVGIVGIAMALTAHATVLVMGRVILDIFK